jgi:hypothetical protein
MSEYNTQNVNSNCKHNAAKLNASRQHTAIDPVAACNTQLADNTLKHHMAKHTTRRQHTAVDPVESAKTYMLNLIKVLSSFAVAYISS